MAGVGARAGLGLGAITCLFVAALGLLALRQQARLRAGYTVSYS
jgi:hypothetical protein